MHDLLMILTAAMPCKTIDINGEPYLERYYVKTDEDGTQHWLHRFLRNDAERHLHSHPWFATSTILCGWYLEALEGDRGQSYVPGEVNLITPDKLHRITDVEPNTWTYMVVQPGRLEQWHFIDDNGVKTPKATSEPEWWKACPTRAAA